jgi:hypothetical protein
MIGRLATCLLATVWSYSAAGQDVEGPYQLMADPPELDLGVILDSPAIQVPFILQNTGVLPLRINNVGINCEECAEYRLDRTELDPDDFAILDLKFDPRDLSGDVELLIAIRTDGLPLKPLVIPIVAFIRPRFELRGVPVMFQDMREGEVRRWRVEVIPGVDLPGSLIRAESDSAGFRAEVSSITDRDSVMVEIEAGPLETTGVHEAIIRLGNGEEGGFGCEIPVSAYRIPNLHYFPSRIVLEPRDQKQFRILFIRQSGNSPISISGIRVPSRHMRYEILRDSGFANYRINLYATGLSKASGLIGHVEIDTNQDDPGQIRVPVHAQSLSDLSIEPSHMGESIIQE